MHNAAAYDGTNEASGTVEKGSQKHRYNRAAINGQINGLKYYVKYKLSL